VAVIGQDEVQHEFPILLGEAAAPNMDKDKELKSDLQNALNDDSMY